ncbi:uncharacterized protein LOC115718111 [Cannabis sativa]|uniref:uncharacterized protein LOC115718111 n=1 Tax=Cannabis sativa TaxID=3483 RepID=UPI0029C9EEF5|nr:uncharacterized protein LOC115718111 [Cannabis sativa]
MADHKNQQQAYPLAPANGSTRSNEETPNSDTTKDELKRKKRIRLAIYIAIFAVFQAIVIGVFGAVIMRAKNPNFRINNIDPITLNKANNNDGVSSFDMKFNAQVRIQNSNFGPYKFDNTTLVFTYGGGAAVGRVNIPKGKVGLQSKKKIKLEVNLSSSNLVNTSIANNLNRDLTAGALTFRCTAALTGKVELMFIMKKKKSTNLDCTIVVDVNQTQLRSLVCK